MNYATRLITAVHRHRFRRAVRALADTAPHRLDGNGPLLLSMVQHRDVPAALLALKSLLRFVPAGQLVVVADPSLTAADRAVFCRHFPGLELRAAAEFRHPDLPHGGTWERLAAIAHYAQRHYVIQLDADTVALAPLAEVVAALAAAQPFTLGTRDHQTAEACGLVAAQARARLREGAHVQLLAESLLDRLDDAASLRYVRGCSGFAGYPAGSFDLAQLCDFSRRMAHLLGVRWQQWGTEQFTSNLLLASMPGFRVLPHPRYCEPSKRSAETVFLHFIGYVRHINGLYARVARDTLAQLPPPRAGR